MKRARNERERRDGVSLCTVVSWWGKCFSSCDALERFPLSRANWANRTRDLLVLHCPRNTLMPISCWALFGLSAECRSSPRSPEKDAHGVHMLGYRLNAWPAPPSSLPAFQWKSSSGGCPGRSLPWCSGQVSSPSPNSKYKLSQHDCPEDWTPHCKSNALPAEWPRGPFTWCIVSQVSRTTHPGEKSLGTDSGWLLPQIFMSAEDK